MIDAKKLKWKDEPKLYYGKKYLGKIFQIENGLWKIEYADKVQSEDCYNLSRAKDNLQRFVLRQLNTDPPSP